MLVVMLTLFLTGASTIVVSPIIVSVGIGDFEGESARANGKVYVESYDKKVYAFGTPTIYLDAPTSVRACENFTVNVNVADVVDLNGWQFKLKWDPTLLEFVDIVEGDFLKTGGSTLWIPLPINETEGWILTSCCFDDPVGVSGSGTLANITFHCTGPGECALVLSRTRLFNSSPETVPWNGYGDFNGDGTVDNVDLGFLIDTWGTSIGHPLYDPRADFNSDGFVDLFDFLCLLFNFGSLDPDPSLVPVEIAHTANGWVTQCTIPDVAVTNVEPFKTIVVQGDSVSINVTVENQGDLTETFNITAYYDDTPIETTTVTNLAPIETTTVILTWNTTSVEKGDYTISAKASVVPCETDITFSTKVDGTVTVIIPGHDVAIKNVATSKTIVGQNYSLSIHITAKNYGNFTETFNVTAYYNSNDINYTTITNLASGEEKTVTLTWNTTGVAKGEYTVSAEADQVLGETDTADNVAEAADTVLVTVPGDVSGDRVCDMLDISMLIDKFMATPSDPRWTSNCDVNCDLSIDMADISIAIDNFMKEW
jgi:hypothetical protein